MNATTTLAKTNRSGSAVYCSLGGWGRLGFHACAGKAPRCPDRVRS